MWAAGAGFVSTLVLRKRLDTSIPAAELKLAACTCGSRIEEQFSLPGPCFLFFHLRYRHERILRNLPAGIGSFLANIAPSAFNAPNGLRPCPLTRFWRSAHGGRLAAPRWCSTGTARTAAAISRPHAGQPRRAPHPVNRCWCPAHCHAILSDPRACFPLLGAASHGLGTSLIIAAGARGVINRYAC